MRYHKVVLMGVVFFALAATVMLAHPRLAL